MGSIASAQDESALRRCAERGGDDRERSGSGNIGRGAEMQNGINDFASAARCPAVSPWLAACGAGGVQGLEFTWRPVISHGTKCGKECERRYDNSAQRQAPPPLLLAEADSGKDKTSYEKDNHAGCCIVVDLCVTRGKSKNRE